VSKLAKSLRRPGVGLGAKAILGELTAGEIVVNRALRSAQIQAVLFATEASPGGLGFGRKRAAPATGDDVERTGQAVSTEGSAGTSN
jgi:hypothetical protein